MADLSKTPGNAGECVGSRGVKGCQLQESTKLEHVLDDRFEVEAGAVEDDRVLGRAQRCDGSGRVGLVAGPYFGQNLVIIRA